jgi:hypothetical protein
MKGYIIVCCALAAVVDGSIQTQAGWLKSRSSFGPKNCVMLSRSAGGSCVITTDCEGIDISKAEFAFDCMDQGNKGDIVRHSFGVGGFEANEEFDTEVKCGRCASPTQVDAAAPVAKPVTPPVQKPKAEPHRPLHARHARKAK